MSLEDMARQMREREKRRDRQLEKYHADNEARLEAVCREFLAIASAHGIQPTGTLTIGNRTVEVWRPMLGVRPSWMDAQAHFYRQTMSDEPIVGYIAEDGYHTDVSRTPQHLLPNFKVVQETLAAWLAFPDAYRD